jgi:hypothetical protein
MKGEQQSAVTAQFSPPCRQDAGVVHRFATQMKARQQSEVAAQG